ncbi:MAG: glycosyltransferase [Bacteroidota bacterium]
MRILQVIANLSVGGAQRVVIDESKGLQKRGMSVTVVSSSDGAFGPWLNELRAAGVQVRLAPGGSRSPRLPALVYKTARDLHPDVAHFHLFPTQYYPSVIPLAANVLVTTEHSTWNNRRRWAFLRSVEKRVYAGYHKVIAISEGVRDALAAWIPEVRHRIEVVPNGFSPERLRVKAKDAKTRCESPGGGVIAVLGELRPEKGHEVLLEAMTYVPGAQLVVAGDGALRGHLESRAGELGVSNRVRFLGRVADVASVLAEVDVVAVPSTREGFGLSALEAMAMGLPIVASDVPGLREVIEQGRSGLLVQPNDAREFGAALQLLLGDRALRQALGEGARQRAGLFSIDAHCERLLQVYERTLMVA